MVQACWRHHGRTVTTSELKGYVFELEDLDGARCYCVYARLSTVTLKAYRYPSKAEVVQDPCECMIRGDMGS